MNMESTKTSMEIFRKKVLFVITLPDLGGAQSHVYEVMKNISAYGIEPVLITGCEGWLTQQAKLLGIKVYIVSEMVREISPVKDICAIRHIARIIRGEHPHIVHCHSSKAGIVGRVAAKLCGVNTVFTAHGWAFTEGVSPRKRKLYRFIENIAGYITKRIICVSEYDRRLGMKMLPAHKDKMITIHNCIPDVPECVHDWEKSPVGKTIRGVVVARFSAQKRNIELLYLLRDFLNAGGDMSLTFIGDGPNLTKAKKIASELKLEKDVEFLGSRSDVVNLLPKYDLFILHSNWEGFPISIIEAMRAGLPVFASDVGGVSEAVKDGDTGFVCKNNEFMNKLIQFWNDKVELNKMGIAGRNEFIRRYAIHNMLKKISAIYFEVT